MSGALVGCEIASPLGTLRAVADADAVVGLYLPAQPPPTAPVAPCRDSAVLAALAEQLAAYFAGARAAFDVPLAPRGTAFQRAVWAALVAIPFGETTSYGALAAALGRPTASRAVGAANGQNPISILVPCHRVVAAGGALTGYAGGLDAKRWLLAHEAAAVTARARPPHARRAGT